MEQDIEVQLNNIKEAEILVGIPSYNNVRTIGHVIQVVTAGLVKYFPKGKSVLIIVDSESTDGTQEEIKRVQIENVKIIFISHPVPPVHKAIIPYHGIPGRGIACRTIFEIAKLLNAKACALADSDLLSITPEWMELLLNPVYNEGFDYVAPLYTQHKFDGTLTKSIVYPLTRTLYGKRVRQPIGGDFGFSGELVKFCLDQEGWETEVGLFGTDIWMTTLATANGFNLCQTHLGPRTCDTKEPTSDLGSMFVQVVSPIYDLMKNYEKFWKKVKGSHPIPTFGLGEEGEIGSLSVDLDRMIRNLRLGVKNLMEIWRRVVSSETALRLEAIARLSDESFSFPQELWVRIIYDFAIGCHRNSVLREHLLKSMIPLYLGWVASFVKENQKKTASEVEESIESLCMLFEEMKPYLIEHWT
jgi:glycosyltransferase involved in cell wall biosynthesis